MSDTWAYKDSELVIALVAPVGTDFDEFIDELTVCLGEFGYAAETIRLSDLASRFKNPEVAGRPHSGSPEYVRIMSKMDEGNASRARGGPDLLALATAAEINAKRPSSSSPDKAPLPRHAHIVRSLKHPAEVETLRRIYGSGLFLIGIDTLQATREKFLAERKGCSDKEIETLFKRDEHEGEQGQRRRDTYQLSDVFVRLGDVKGLKRILNLVFGFPYETPTPDEYAMFLAFAAALRSGDLSRQVGAVVVSSAGDIVSVGTNDVPKAGGGLCWPGSGDDRDLVHGKDTNQTERDKIVDEILNLIAPIGIEDQGSEAIATWKTACRARLQNAAVMDITEYGRPVHAEMEALLSCARTGVSTRGAMLFSTTFPCHNCAKHLLAAGIERVVYVEPYAKSRASDFYPRSITVEGVDMRPADGPTVVFEPFRGVGPRRFFDLFSMGLGSGYAVRRKERISGRKRDWNPTIGEVRVHLLPNSYLVRERAAAEQLLTIAVTEEDKP